MLPVAGQEPQASSTSPLSLDRPLGFGRPQPSTQPRLAPPQIPSPGLPPGIPSASPHPIADPSVDAWFQAAPQRDLVSPWPTLSVPAPQSLLAPQNASWPLTSDNPPPAATSSTAGERALWADAPQFGEHFFDPTPKVNDGIGLLPYQAGDFSPDPVNAALPYDGNAEWGVYSEKGLYATQRPLLEWGRQQYPAGQFPRSLTFLGDANLVTPQLLVYGDFRTALASNRAAGDATSVWANRLNLDIDFEITSTERFHAFMGPLDTGNRFTRVEYDGGDARFVPEFDADIDFAFFEGDVGAIYGGMSGKPLPFTLPVAMGVFPMFLQNGYWMNDALLGVATTIPARNSALLDIANYDVTFFAGFDELDSPAFGSDDDAAQVFGTVSWIEAFNGYVELGYAFVDDRTGFDRSYHNLTAAYSRRYGALLSNSVRVIANVGQEPNGIAQTADGCLLLIENSLITRRPWTFVPYFNLYAGFDRPQSVARAAGAGGILNHAGINFETDGLTGYPTLDASANNTYGGAFGLNLLPQDFSQQLVVETAIVQAFGEDATRIARGDQYGIGLRYQIPISNAVLLRFDAMHGFLDSDDDVSGIRFELRHKF